MTSLLGLDNATSGGQRGSKPAPPNGTRQLSGTDLIRRLDGCSQKALDMLTTLPPRFKKMTDAHRNVSMQVANSEGCLPTSPLPPALLLPSRLCLHTTALRHAWRTECGAPSQAPLARA